MRIKFKPTGNIFDLPEEEARRIVIEDKGFNYEVLDGEIKIDDEISEKTSVYNLIVNGNQPDDSKKSGTEDEKEQVKPFEQWTIPELKAKLDDMNIKYSKSAKKDDLLELFKENKIPLTDNETKSDEETQDK